MPGPDAAAAELVAAHVAGRLPPPLDAVVAAHVGMSPAARRFAGDLEALAGRAIEAAAPVALIDRDARLARIFATDAPARMPREAPPFLPDADRLPAPLARFVGERAARTRWRHLWFGIESRDFGVADGFSFGLMRIAGGRAVPEHGHRGLEATLVLTGGFADGGRAFRPGDLHVCDETIEHAPVADPEGCLCAFAIAGPGAVPTHVLGRLWMRLIG